MQFKYFRVDYRTSIEECKKQYRKLVFQHHPDRGGDDDAMKQVNAEWEYLRKHNFNIHMTKDGSVYTDHRQTVPDEVTEHFAAIINALVKLDGIVIEICGSFIWLSGETYEYRKALKALGFKWARRKKMWYMAPPNYRKSGPEMTMNEIRMHYGSKMVTEAVEREELPALMA